LLWRWHSRWRFTEQADVVQAGRRTNEDALSQYSDNANVLDGYWPGRCKIRSEGTRANGERSPNVSLGGQTRLRSLVTGFDRHEDIEPRHINFPFMLGLIALPIVFVWFLLLPG